MGGMLRGASDFLFGFRAIVTTPGLWGWVWIPVIINTAMYALVVGAGVYYFGDLLEMLLPAGEAWYFAVARVLGWVVFSATVAFGVYFTFFALCVLVAAPFNDVLSAKYEALTTGASVDEGLAIPAVIRQEVKRFIGYVLIFAALVAVTALLSLVPVINLLVPLLWAVFAGFVSAFEFLSYPLDRRGRTAMEKLSFVRSGAWRALGFGLMVAGAMAIPVLNLAVIPSAVVGATRLVLDVEGEA